MSDFRNGVESLLAGKSLGYLLGQVALVIALICTAVVLIRLF